MSNVFQDSVLGQIGSLIEELNGTAVKSAAQKSAENQAGGDGSAGRDPGGHRGKSTHPSARADAGTQAGRTGARAEENARDVEESVPANVQGDAPSGNADYNQIQIGTKKAPTGEDPSSEDAYKGSKEDPGTAHPANAENVGEKYSSWNFAETYKVACDLTERVIARVANGESLGTDKAASSKNTGNDNNNSNNSNAVDTESIEFAAAGYELSKLAQQLGQTTVDDSVIKFAAARDITAAFLKEAAEEADLVGEYLYKIAAGQEEMLAQAAMGEGGAPPMDPAMMGGGAGGPPPEMGGGGPPMDPAMMGGELPPEMGGGAPPPGPGGPEGEGGEGGEADVNEIANALLDAGIPPEQLMEAIQMMAQGGGPGGAEGGMSPEEAKSASAKLPRNDAHLLWKSASNAVALMEQGRFRRVRPNNKAAHDSRSELVNYLQYVREVLRF